MFCTAACTAAKPAAAVRQTPSSAPRRNARRPAAAQRLQPVRAAEDDRAAQLKAAMEQVQSNPEVRPTGVVGLMAVVGMQGLQRWGQPCTPTADTHSCLLAWRPARLPASQHPACPHRPSPCCSLLAQMASKMKQMEEAMANPAVQAQMGQMM